MMHIFRLHNNATALAGLLALLFLIAGGTGSAVAQIDCTSGPGPNQTIVIYNNSTDYNIYPIMFAGAASGTDEWMQACFKIPVNQIKPVDNFPHPRASQYRLYVNCCKTGEDGIPPGGSVTITLPFYSPLVSKIDPKGNAQFIDWWQGGGINIFAGPKTSTTAPAIVQNHWNDDTSNSRGVTPFSNPPTCGSKDCALHFFVAPNSIANWEPQQLVEYSLGAQPANAKAGPKDPFFLWVPDNVDYDLSNVNFAYLPAAIEPFGNTLNGTCCAIGWIGSTAAIGDFIDPKNGALHN